MNQPRTLPPFKQGDTFSVGGTIKGIADGAIATAWLNDPAQANLKIAELTVTLDTFIDLATARAILIVSTADTSAWPPGDLKGDIKFVAAGITLHSQTFVVPVVRAETK